MQIADAGVLPSSFVDFTIPSEFARRALYFIPEFGHYRCVEGYEIDRPAFDWHLLVYVRAGALYVETERYCSQVAAGQMALVDCREPHRYYCRDTVDFQWFHFSGGSSDAYIDHFSALSTMVFRAGDVEERLFGHIFLQAQLVPCNEHLISASIHGLLAQLAAPREEERSSQPVEGALRCIRERFADPLTVETLAAACSMSVSHFIRSFQKHLGRTPHEYLLGFRLQRAKQMLYMTDRTVEQIAEDCGFNSASHFARAFRAANGCSPTAFRKVRF